METNNIELFDNYIDERLSPQEKEAFEVRLKEDKGFAQQFRIYLFVLDGINKEGMQDSLDFGIAMKNISEEGLLRAMSPRRKKPFSYRNLLWGSSVAAMFIIGIFSVFTVRRNEMNRVDDIIVAYNYLPSEARGGETVSDDIESLEMAYQKIPADDLQEGEEIGMRLAMAYLKAHDRKKATALLEELSVKYADDEMYAGQCRRILEQLK